MEVNTFNYPPFEGKLFCQNRQICKNFNPIPKREGFGEISNFYISAWEGREENNEGKRLNDGWQVMGIMKGGREGGKYE